MKNIKSMLRYLTLDVCSIANFVAIRPSTYKMAGTKGGLAWSLTYNRLFVGVKEIIDRNDPKIRIHLGT